MSRTGSGEPYASVAPRLVRRELGRVDHDVGAHRQRGLPPRRHEVDGDDRTDAQPPQRRDRRTSPIAPQPMTSGTSFGVTAARVRRRTSRPRSRRRSPPARSGSSVGTTCVIASVSRKYSPKPPGASALWPMTRTPSAHEQRRDRAHPRADRPSALGAGPVVDDLGAVLVAHHDVGVGVVVRQPGVVVGVALGMVHEVEVRRADPTRQRAHEDLPRAGHRVGRLAGLHHSAPQHRCSHDVLPGRLRPRRPRHAPKRKAPEAIQEGFSYNPPHAIRSSPRVRLRRGRRWTSKARLRSSPAPPATSVGRAFARSRRRGHEWWPPICRVTGA